MSILKYILLGILVASVTVAIPLSSDDLEVELDESDEIEVEFEVARELEEEDSQAEREFAGNFDDPGEYEKTFEKHISDLNNQKPKKVCGKEYEKVSMSHDNADKYIVTYKDGKRWKSKSALLFESLGAPIVRQYKMPIKGKSSEVKVTTANGHAFQIKEICVIGFGVKKVDIYADGKLVETVKPILATSSYASVNCHRFKKPQDVKFSAMLKYEKNVPSAFNQGFYAQACIKN